ncbi:VOC family protein [Dyella telluris]|uniref:VOC family protein n=1 Tax=Dyella telluris TaxID=2763498 RepID=A0A7G8Q371_9GAMM|nr:VOC family protein [Dyella telluris]QNK01229.1 VOC family protein [Dyella telluris]
MNFVSTRIITTHVDRLVRFYEAVTGITATRYTEDFAELATPACTLAIGSTRTLALFGGQHVAEAAANRTTIIEFRADDVDATYAGLSDLPAESLVQPPTTMPWGNRSLLFRDPDGNLVNVFTPVTPEAIARQQR